MKCKNSTKIVIFYVLLIIIPQTVIYNAVACCNNSTKESTNDAKNKFDPSVFTGVLLLKVDGDLKKMPADDPDLQSILYQLQLKLPKNLKIRLYNNTTKHDSVLGVVKLRVKIKEKPEKRFGDSNAPGIHRVFIIKEYGYDYTIDLETKLFVKAYSNWNTHVEFDYKYQVEYSDNLILNHIPDFRFLNPSDYYKTIGSFGWVTNIVNDKYVFPQFDSTNRFDPISRKGVSLRFEMISQRNILNRSFGGAFGLNLIFGPDKKFEWIEYDTVRYYTGEHYDYYLEPSNHELTVSLFETSMDFGPSYGVMLGDLHILSYLNLGVGVEMLFFEFEKEKKTKSKALFQVYPCAGVRLFYPIFYSLGVSVGGRLLFPLIKHKNKVEFHNRNFYYQFNESYLIQFDISFSGKRIDLLKK